VRILYLKPFSISSSRSTH